MPHEMALKPLDSAIWELGEAFEGLQDEDVWVRPHPRLLSVGELAAHIAFGEVRWLFPECESPLATEQASYYLDMVGQPFTMPIGAQELYAEVKRAHELCREHVLQAKPNLDAVLPNRDDWTWGYALQYMAFHVAYHTGQIYSVRHLLGHETANN